MVLPFLTLPRETQLMIYSKIRSRDLLRVASSCMDAFMFTYEHRKTLSARLEDGEMCALTNTDSKTIAFCVDFDWHMSEIEFPFDEDFYDKVALISMFQLDIRIEEASLIPQALEIVKRWNPLCLHVYFNHRIIPFSTVLEFTGHIRAMTFDLEINHALFTEMKDRMLQSEKRGCFHLIMKGDEWEYDNIYENMKHFRGFNLSIKPEYIDKFFSDLIAHRDPGNLEYFILDCSRSYFRPYEFHEILSPYATLLFVNYEEKRINEKSVSWTIQKLPLKNNLCAIVERKNESRGPTTREVNVDIIMGDEEKVLDFLLTKKLRICEKTFTQQKRRRYLEMNDSERLEELGMHYGWHNHIAKTKHHLGCRYWVWP